MTNKSNPSPSPPFDERVRKSHEPPPSSRRITLSNPNCLE